MNLEIKKIQRAVYIVGLIVILSLTLLIWFLMRSFTAISVAPRLATVLVDGKKMKVVAGETNVNTTIGEHLVTVEADGHIGYSQTLSFTRGIGKKINITLDTLPEPVKLNENGEFLTKGSDFNDGYYLSNKTIYKAKVGLDAEGKIKVLENRAITDSKITDVTEIIWSPKKELALLRKSNGVTLFDFMKYDFINQTEAAWGSTDIGSIAWAPDNSKIAYYYAPSTGEKSLIFTNIINTEMERVANFAELGINNPILKWSPDSEWLLVIPRNRDLATNKIYLFNTYTRTIKVVADSGYHIDGVFSPDSNKILYSTLQKTSDSPVESVIGMMNKDGSDNTELGIRAELTKVAWAKDSRTIVVATLGNDPGRESIFQFDTVSRKQSGFSIKDLGKIFIDSIAYSDDGKIVLYEESGKVFALKVGS